MRQQKDVASDVTVGPVPDAPAETAASQSDLKRTLVIGTSVEVARAKLVELERQADGSVWEFAVYADAAVESLKKSDDAADEDLFKALSEGTRFTADTVKVRVLTPRKLREYGMDEVTRTRCSGFSQIAAIVIKSGLEEKAKKALVKKVVEHDRKSPDEAYTVEEVWTEIRRRKPKSSADIVTSFTDFWGFPDFAEGFGLKDFPGRVPGQAAERMIRLWLPEKGRVFAAMCGSGTMLDVAQHLKSDYRGIDLVLEQSVKERHKDNVRPFDATEPDWVPAFKDDWRSDLTVITPPRFHMPGTAATRNNKDLANISDPQQYLDAYVGIAKGATSITKPGGIVAVVTSASPEFEKVGNDHEFQILSVFHKAGWKFVGRAVFRVGKGAPKPAKDSAHLVPEVRHVNVFRTSA